MSNEAVKKVEEKLGIPKFANNYYNQLQEVADLLNLAKEKMEKMGAAHDDLHRGYFWAEAYTSLNNACRDMNQGLEKKYKHEQEYKARQKAKEQAE